MGRRKQPKRKLSKRQRGQRILPKTHDSEPEKSALPNEEDRESLAWDSLDEIHLPPTPSGAEYLPSPDEMEVTRRLSCLNFSMLPCLDPAVNSEPSSILLNEIRPDPMAIDVDLNSLGGGNFDVLPSLSDRESGRLKQSRKRPSRRKPNKRMKKSRHSLNNSRDGTTLPKHGASPHPLCVSFVRPTHKDPQFSRAKLFRRPRRSKSQQEDDPLLCCFSDTSVFCDVDEFGSERMDDDFDLTPPMELCVGGVRGVEGVEGALNDSDLSESTTSDSGCEGDDEESSVEGPLSRASHLSPTLREQSSSEDEQFSRILHGAYPLMTQEGQKQFHNQLYAELPPEFKHPGRVRLSGGGRRKKRCKPTQPPTLLDVNQQIVRFIQDSAQIELKFNLVSRAMCRTISCLASVYNLNCYIEQKRRLPVASPLLRKSPLTRLASRQEVEPILRNHGRESPTMLLKDSLAYCTPMDTIETMATILSHPHSVVGQGIPPLSESNLGNQMLRNMGWTPGTGLGIRSNGIQDPVRAELRPKKSGLGYS